MYRFNELVQVCGTEVSRRNGEIAIPEVDLGGIKIKYHSFLFRSYASFKDKGHVVPRTRVIPDLEKGLGHNSESRKWGHARPR